MILNKARSAFLAAPMALVFFASPVLAQDANSGQEEQTNSSDVQLPLTDTIRQTSNEELQQITYDLIALQHNVHQAHWNVQGIEYYQLHEFYGELYEALQGYIDSSAERKLALGAWADGRLRPTADATNIETIPEGYLTDEETLNVLAQNYSTMSGELYDAIEATSDDAVTQDLLIGFTHTIDKHFWQIRAHLGNGNGQGTGEGASGSTGAAEGGAAGDSGSAN